MPTHRSTNPLRRAAPVFSAAALMLAQGALAARPASAAPTAPVGQRVTLLDISLKSEPVTLVRIDPGSQGRAPQVLFVDSRGERRTRPMDQILALAPASWSEPAASATGDPDEGRRATRFLELVDGQRFAGEFDLPGLPTATGSSAKTDDANVLWRSSQLGPVRVPLEQVARMVGDADRLAGALQRPLSTVTDTVILASGDRVEGLVEVLGPEIEIDQPNKGAGSTHARTSIPADQAILVSLVNPTKPLGGAAVWLSDGSVVATDRLGFESDTGKVNLRARLGSSESGRVLLDAADVEAVAPEASRLFPLAGLPIASQLLAPERPTGTPAQVEDSPSGSPLGAAAISLPGPMTVEWTLPTGARAVIGAAALDERSYVWGDCTITVSVVAPGDKTAERVVARGRLRAESPVLALNTPLTEAKPGDRLRVSISAGDRGPVQDRVILRRMLIVTGAP